MLEIIVTSVVSILTGAGSVLLFFPQIRKSKVLDNEAKQSEEWKKLYEEERNMREEDRKVWEEDRGRYETKIDTLYDQISHQRDCKAELSKDNATLQVENTRLCLLKCEVPNCPNRKPPTGY